MMLDNIYDRNLYKFILLSDNVVQNLKIFSDWLKEYDSTLIYNEKLIQTILKRQ